MFYGVLQMVVEAFEELAAWNQTSNHAEQFSSNTMLSGMIIEQESRQSMNMASGNPGFPNMTIAGSSTIVEGPAIQPAPLLAPMSRTHHTSTLMPDDISTIYIKGIPFWMFFYRYDPALFSKLTKTQLKQLNCDALKNTISVIARVLKIQINTRFTGAEAERLVGIVDRVTFGELQFTTLNEDELIKVIKWIVRNLQAMVAWKLKRTNCGLGAQQV
ncbi:unnamed protein product [Caenorhabditis bovis]|uniref:Uncharacterized protein n=1 Tax=Caenorhabditis bovis TaxID=2654633 RepID=A0A8S1FFJ2_9PELO|nr:unnamed protein product [Caenorhabditis bovis]